MGFQFNLSKGSVYHRRLSVDSLTVSRTVIAFNSRISPNLASSQMKGRNSRVSIGQISTKNSSFHGKQYVVRISVTSKLAKRQ